MITLWTLLLAAAFGLCCALVAVVYAVVLAGEDTPLNAWFRFLERMDERRGLTSWIASPLGACEKCCAGHLGLWASQVIEPWAWDASAIVTHLVASSSAVLFASTIARRYRCHPNRS